MHVLFRLTVCLCMIILAGGSIHYVHDDPSFGGGFLLFMIWGIFATLIICTDVFDFSKMKSKSNGDENDRSRERLAQLEKRLGDIQDIVITIDEKLSWAEKQSNARLEDGEKV